MPSSKRQIAALPVRLDKNKRVEVLLVTSRGSGRWLPPKGSEMSGKSRHKCAEIEALEEAGVSGKVVCKPVGHYVLARDIRQRQKRCPRVIIYPLIVERVLKSWKEAHERERRWFSLKSAAGVVNEPDLQALLLSLKSDLKFKRLLH